MEARLFEEGTVPAYTQPGWYVGRESAPHVEEYAHRGRLDITARFVNQIARRYFDAGSAPTVVDLGCGDGGLLTLLDPEIEAWGYDLAPANVEASTNRRKSNEDPVDVRFGDILEDDLAWGRIAVATEVLEHLVDPHAFVRKIAENSFFLVASSPFTETTTDHYEFHTWAWDIEGYTKLLEQGGFSVETVEFANIFQIFLARKTAA